MVRNSLVNCESNSAVGSSCCLCGGAPSDQTCHPSKCPGPLSYRRPKREPCLLFTALRLAPGKVGSEPHDAALPRLVVDEHDEARASPISSDGEAHAMRARSVNSSSTAWFTPSKCPVMRIADPTACPFGASVTTRIVAPAQSSGVEPQSPAAAGDSSASRDVQYEASEPDRGRGKQQPLEVGVECKVSHAHQCDGEQAGKGDGP